MVDILLWSLGLLITLSIIKTKQQKKAILLPLISKKYLNLTSGFFSSCGTAGNQN